MGSLAFAAGGAAAGLGQGLEKVGENAMLELRMAALMRLKEDFESQSQVKGFEHQEAMQQKQFGEQEKMHGIEHGEQVAAAGAQRGFLEEQEARKEKAAEKRTRITAQSRVDVAGIRADAQSRAAAAAHPPGPLLKHAGDYQLQGTVSNGQLVPGARIPIYQHRDGRTFVAAGSRFLPFDSSTGKLPDAKSVGRGNAKAEQDLLADPTGMTPDGKSTKLDAFINAYGYVPGGYFAAQERAQQAPPTGGGPLGKAAPPGATWHPASAPPGSGGEAYTDNAAEDAQADAEDAQAENENSADDEAPAKEPG